MQPRMSYRYTYVPGPMEATRSAWNEFQSQSLDCQRGSVDVHFIPATGGCFVVLQPEEDQHSTRWRSLIPTSLWLHHNQVAQPPDATLRAFNEFLQLRNPGSHEPRSVMVVDDDSNLLRLVNLTLQSSGFDVKSFQDGRTALQSLEVPSAPHVVVLDLNMPGMDGREFFREFKTSGADSRVLIASAYQARSAQRELGADGWIAKPFLPDELLDRVEALCP
jgi:two-component system, chemotaxis family, chemotaxis protein CheY